MTRLQRFVLKLLMLAAFVAAYGLTLCPVLTACNIPVFRYALENWIPDKYHVLIVHKGELQDEQSSLTDRLARAGHDGDRPANILVHVVDLDGNPATDETERRELPPEFTQALWSRLQGDDLTVPRIIAFYPGQLDAEFPAWSAPLDEKNCDALVDSPQRMEIANRLLDGQSAVWVLIDSGDAAKDQAAFDLLTRQLEELESKVKLPDRNLIEAEQEFRADNPIELRVDFSLIRVSRDDPREQALVSMLLGSEPDLRDFQEPIALPIFGRGRTYFALIGSGITAANIEQSCRFVCGACSCQVKQQNPGVDLLIAVDWAKKITGSAMRDPELPELTGIGGLEMAANVTHNQPTANTSPPVDAPSPAVEPAPVDRSAVFRPDVLPASPASDESMGSGKDYERSLAVRAGMLVVACGAVLAVISFWFWRR